jgi:hypothetical protein
LQDLVIIPEVGDVRVGIECEFHFHISGSIRSISRIMASNSGSSTQVPAR